MKKMISVFIAACLGVLIAWYTIGIQEKTGPYVTILGFPASGSGLPANTLEWIRALEGDVSLKYVTLRGSKPHGKVSRDIKSLFMKNFSPNSKVVLVNEPLWTPSNTSLFHHFIAKTSEDQLKIAYSQFPATAIPHEWVFILNEYFDAVAVPNVFLADVYEKSGVTIPIFEIPSPMDLEELLSKPLKKTVSNPMIFANFASCEDRNNHMVLISAFAKAFGNQKDVLLMINTERTEPFLRKYLQWEIDDLGLENVRLTELVFDRETYLDQLGQVDCYVSVAKGEGFPHLCLEAMALGIPVVVTNNTAQTTLCESGFVRSISSNKVEPARHYQLGNLQCGKFFGCDAHEVANAFLDVYNHYESYLKKAEEGREWVRSFDYQNLKPICLNLVKPKKVILGDENKVTEEYLMTTSSSLFTKYQNL